MIRSTMFAAALAVAAIASPAMATDFSIQASDSNGWYPWQWVNQGAYTWQTDSYDQFAFDKTLTTSVSTDSLIKVFLAQSQPGFFFTDVFVNGVSIASNFWAPTSETLIGSGYAEAGTVSLRFVGYNTTVSHSFGGHVNATKAIIPVTAPVPEPATWAMMLVGVAAVGTMLRRRSVKVSFV